MPGVTAEIEFLARLDRYQHEKPYLMLLGEDEEADADVPVSNLEFEIQRQVPIRDMRGDASLHFAQCGFEYVSDHQSAISHFQTAQDIANYRSETEELLRRRFDAIKVHTYEVKLRQNLIFDRDVYDVNDSLVVEGPARGAHNGWSKPRYQAICWLLKSELDVTLESARGTIQKHLSGEDKHAYMRPGFRMRIINTWRPLNLVLEDRPLALCDSRTVLRDDLIPSDRVLPDRASEIYYLHYAPQQQWYWLENQKSTEPFIFLMFDTHTSIGSARLCPHVSFDNPRASVDASKRSSVETRSIVVTRERGSG